VLGVFGLGFNYNYGSSVYLHTAYEFL
jgi:hypothetical protein